MKNNNPLQQYFRKIQSYISLPSQGIFYSKNVLDIDTITDEIPIMAMTGKDELNLKNPEGLLNGESVKELILNCTKGIKDPFKLLSMDLEVIMASIRLHSYGNEMEVKSVCPNCDHENTHSINLEALLESAKKIDREFPITLENNLTIFLKPFTFECNLKANLAGLEQEKISKKIDSLEVEDPEYLKIISLGVNNLGNLNFDILSMCIDKIIDEDNNINIKNDTKEHKKWISELLYNITRSDSERMNTKITEISKEYGLKKEYEIQCQNEECKKVYNTPLVLDPTAFFLPSSILEEPKI